MSYIKGIPVVLTVKNQVGNDDFEAPIFHETQETVENVLVTPVSSSDVLTDVQLYGKKTEYELCIPKGDTHTWTDTKVEIFGKAFQTVGRPREYINNLVPLEWNQKIKVVLYE